jgi:hypothetical protein
MKYIMFEVTHGRGANKITRLVPIIFPNILVHADVAAQVQRVPGLVGAKIVRGGEAHIACYDAFGSSETLNVKAAEKDADVISRYDYFHGIA